MSDDKFIKFIEEAMRPLMEEMEKINTEQLGDFEETEKAEPVDLDEDDTEIEVEDEPVEEPEDRREREPPQTRAAPQYAERPTRPQKQGQRYRPSKIARLSQERDMLAAQKQELQEMLVRERQGAVTYYSKALELQKESAKKELARAIEHGDAEAQAEYSDVLARINTKIEDAKSGRYSQPYTPEPAYSQAYPADEYEEYDGSAREEWQERNQTWLNPRSRHYDPEFVSFAEEAYKELKRYLVFNGHEEEVDTPEFYDGLDRILRDRYTIQQDEPAPRAQAAPAVAPRAQGKPRAYSQPVAPVNYSGANHVAKAQSTSRKVYLTEQQRETALMMPYKHPDGRNFTDKEKLETYARNLRDEDGRR